MKRSKKRITVTGKMVSETKQEQYWDNWAQRMAQKRDQDQEAECPVCHTPEDADGR